MKNDEKKDKKKKKISVEAIISAITLIFSLANLTYSLITVDSIITNIAMLSIPVFIFILSCILFLGASKNSIKKEFIIILSVIIVLFMSFMMLNKLNILTLPQDEKMVSYENESYKSLSKWADKNNIELVVNYEYSDSIDKGNIIRLDTNPGDLVKNINKITVTVSEGPDYDKIVVVPSMVGWNIDEVTKFIKDNHILSATINYVGSDELKDTVINQDKNGDIRRNQEFVLTISLGPLSDLPLTVKMIDLTNKSLFDATLWLKQNNIKYTIEYEFSSTIERNIVIKQNTNKDEEINTTTGSVLLTISKGTAIVVPDILKMTVEDITNWIVNNKLKVSFNEIYDETVTSGKIISSSVNKGDKIEINTLVTVTISKGQIKMQAFASLGEFKTWANKYNIAYNESYEYSNTIAKGSVISYSYNENDIIDPDGIIYVKVSLGKAITIPSFIGKSRTDANNICNSIGIRCSFVTGGYTSYAVNIVYAQSKYVGARVASGSAITLTLSKGIPTTKTLYIQQNWLSIGNADATITSLNTQFANNYPGVSFNFIKVKDNTLSSGMISKSSPTNHGSSVTQGKTYTIYIVSN